MRAMMLHSTAVRSRQSESVRSGRILRMAIVRNHEIVPSHIVHGDQIDYCFFKGAEGLVVIQVAEVLADKRLPIDDECNRVLEVGAKGENRAFGGQYGDRSGGISTRTTQDHRTKNSSACDRVVD